MFKKIILILLLICLVLTPAFSAAELSYKPYSEDEFPVWTQHLRRAESLFFGSYVITLPVSILAYNTAGLFLSTPDDAATRIGHQAIIATGLSLTIALVDYFLGLNND